MKIFFHNLLVFWLVNSTNPSQIDWGLCFFYRLEIFNVIIV